MKYIIIILDIQTILHQILLTRMKVSQIKWNKVSKIKNNLTILHQILFTRMIVSQIKWNKVSKIINQIINNIKNKIIL